MAPIAPFFSEVVYRQLMGENKNGQPESIHLTDFPKSDESVLDSRLESSMAFVKQVVSLALAARKRKNLKVRQPLSRIIIQSENGKKAGEDITEIILRELNIKNIEFTDDAGKYVSYSAKPNFAILGPKFGKSVGQVSEIITSLSSADVKRFGDEESLEIDFLGRRIKLISEDIEIIRNEMEGYAVEGDGAVVIALDTTLSPELIDEGFAREIVNKIQNMRKASGFQVTDRIQIRLQADEPLAGAVNRFEKYICNETLADSLERTDIGGDDNDTTEWTINGEKAIIAVERL
jgi:isoleucyl-tRNA synthetase